MEQIKRNFATQANNVFKEYCLLKEKSRNVLFVEVANQPKFTAALEAQIDGYAKDMTLNNCMLLFESLQEIENDTTENVPFDDIIELPQYANEKAFLKVCRDVVEMFGE